MNLSLPLDWEYDGEADTLYISFGNAMAKRLREVGGLDSTGREPI